MNSFSGEKVLAIVQELRIRGLGFWARMPKHTRIALGVVVPIALVVILLPVQEASAQTGWLLDVAYSVVAKIVFGIAWVMSYIAGIVLSVLAWITEVVLAMSTQVVNSTPVRTGFPIALAVTNMGFVAAVIIIAVATILRYGDYVVKKTLPKLIAAALLVNFSLVFAGAILNFADQFTLYFLREISPAASTGSSFTNFSSAMAGAFNPQREFLSKIDDNSGGNQQLEGTASVVGKGFGNLIIPITSVSFTLFTLIAILLTMVAFVALLLIRYVYLVVLLIVMPFVWLMWIFPGTKSYFSDWWKKFLKQVFFAPVAVFFLYLAILTAGAMSGTGTGGAVGVSTNLAASETGNAIADFFGGAMVGSVQNSLNSLIIIGLMMGGMFAASKVGAAGASAAQKAVVAGTGAIGLGLHSRAPGAVARKMTSMPSSTPPQKGTGLGRVLYPFKWAGYKMKQAGEALPNAFQRRMSQTEEGRERLSKMSAFAEKELKERAKSEGIKDKDFARGVRPMEFSTWLAKETFGKIMFGTFNEAGLKMSDKLKKKFGIKDGHITAEEIKKRGIEVHGGHDDHDDDHGDSHGGDHGKSGGDSSDSHAGDGGAHAH